MLKQLTPIDVRLTDQLGDLVYGDELWEPPEVMASRIALYPQGCMGSFEDGRLVGYVFSHPWTSKKVVPIGKVMKNIPRKADCYYIHDLAVHPKHRRRGHAKALADAALKLGESKGFRRFMLVSVRDTAGFWESFGFKSAGKMEYAPGIMGTKMVRRI
jgi:ribosomal protein S18 acetylase RimI-like enzyme